MTRRSSARLALGGLLASAICGLLWVHHLAAGPLWRDEVNSVNAASLGSLGDVLAHRHFDSFPSVWLPLLHSWIDLGLGATDAGLRGLGVAIALATVGVLWWMGLRVGGRPPLVALLLFGLSPSTLIYGSAVRGYGIAALGLAWCVGAVWTFVQQPSRRTFGLAQLAAIFATQSNYANCFLLPAVVAGGAALCVRRGDWRTVRALAAIGVIAALLMAALNHTAIDYMPRTGTLERGSWPLSQLLQVATQAPAAGVLGLGLGWIVAVVSALAGFTGIGRAGVATLDRDRAIFTVVTTTCAVVAYFTALKWGGLPTQFWHYLSLMAILALACDVGTALLAQRVPHGEPIRLGAIALLMLLALPSVAHTVRLRMSNLDLVARTIESTAKLTDLVVVFPWYCGITFQRYYQGSAPWITLPDFDEHMFHQHLIVAEKMQRGDAAVAPELARVERTLREGGAVWIVGTLVAPNPGVPFPSLPPPPTGPRGWQAAPYLDHWEQQLGRLLEQHVAQGDKVPVATPVPVNTWENLPLFRVTGWRD